ncbi:hypothetical protein J6590_070009 [Homalodisca vitripennis]|nr:hypothetical protein J6590_070009 [Homalodisca vitripennis]
MMIEWPLYLLIGGLPVSIPYALPPFKALTLGVKKRDLATRQDVDVVSQTDRSSVTEIRSKISCPVVDWMCHMLIS